MGAGGEGDVAPRVAILGEPEERLLSHFAPQPEPLRSVSSPPPGDFVRPVPGVVVAPCEARGELRRLAEALGVTRSMKILALCPSVFPVLLPP